MSNSESNIQNPRTITINISTVLAPSDGIKRQRPPGYREDVMRKLDDFLELSRAQLSSSALATIE